MLGFILITLSLYLLPQLACLSQDGSSLNLSYNGGKIMTKPVTVSILWFGKGWEESGKEAIRNAISSLTPSRYNFTTDSGVPTLGNWWEIIRQYTDSSNVAVTDIVDVGAECFYVGPQLNVTLDHVIEVGRSVFNETLIDKFGENLNCNRVFEANENSIHHVVFSNTVMFLDKKEQRDLMDLCSGYFETVVSGSRIVKMDWVRAPQNSEDLCSEFFHGAFYLGPPNGDEKIDSLVGYLLAQIAEEVTNRDGRGWTSNDGSELTVRSCCVNSFKWEKSGPPFFKDEERNVSFNAVGLNGYRYVLQYVWDQRIGNCALKSSEACVSSAVILHQPKGYINKGIIVNHTTGLQPYPPNQKCQWMISHPTAKFIGFTIYLSIDVKSEDRLMICPSDSTSSECSVFPSNNQNANSYLKLRGSKATIQFTSGNHVLSESRGWELSYSVGQCDGKEDLYDHEGVINYSSTNGFLYEKGLTCQWVLRGKPGTVVSLSFTRINISKDLDFLAIYNGATTQIANFSGLYLDSNLPQMNLLGEVLIAFATQTDTGTGWSANFRIASPLNPDSTPVMIVVGIVLSIVAVSFSLAFITIVIFKRKKRLQRRRKFDGTLGLMRAENIIVEGPSSIVYKAVSRDGNHVAIKCTKVSNSQTDLEEEILLKFCSHPNIISLLGYVEVRIQRRELVFEYMGKGNLSWNLQERGENLDWEKRLAIALQISLAVQTLHIYSNKPIYHGNIKSENIFLDDSFNAKLGGFGSASYCKNKMEMAGDIWSFGLLLLELLVGESIINQCTSDLTSNFEINEFVWNYKECLDQRLGIPNEECKIMALVKLGEIAKWCICTGLSGGGNSISSSPKISDVVLGLKQVKQLFCSDSS